MTILYINLFSNVWRASIESDMEKLLLQIRMLIIANLFRISDRAIDRSFPSQAGKSSNASLRMRDYQGIIAD